MVDEERALDGPVDNKEKDIYNEGFKAGYESIDVPLARKILQLAFVNDPAYAYSYVGAIAGMLTEYDIKYTKTHKLSRDIFRALYWGVPKSEQKEGEDVIKRMDEKMKDWNNGKKSNKVM